MREPSHTTKAAQQAARRAALDTGLNRAARRLLPEQPSAPPSPLSNTAGTERPRPPAYQADPLSGRHDSVSERIASPAERRRQWRKGG